MKGASSRRSSPPELSPPTPTWRARTMSWKSTRSRRSYSSPQSQGCTPSNPSNGPALIHSFRLQPCGPLCSSAPSSASSTSTITPCSCRWKTRTPKKKVAVTTQRRLQLCVRTYNTTASHTHQEISAHGDDHRFCQVDQEFLRYYETPSTSSHL